MLFIISRWFVIFCRTNIYNESAILIHMVVCITLAIIKCQNNYR